MKGLTGFIVSDGKPVLFTKGWMFTTPPATGTLSQNYEAKLQKHGIVHRRSFTVYEVVNGRTFPICGSVRPQEAA